MSKRPTKGKQLGKSLAKPTTTSPPSPTHFDEVLRLIDSARSRAVAVVNTALIELYWTIGEHISGKIAKAAVCHDILHFCARVLAN